MTQIEEKKRCRTCNRKKRISLFKKENRFEDGYANICKSCHNKVNNTHRQTEGYKKKQAKKKAGTIWKVYIVTSVINEKFYIGMTSKEGKMLDTYFGSNKESGTWEDREKTILYEAERKSQAKYVELFLQMCYRTTDECVNDMFNIRVNGKHMKELTDDDIFKVREHASRVLEMWEQRRSSNIRGRDDPLLQLQLLLSEPQGEA